MKPLTWAWLVFSAGVLVNAWVAFEPLTWLLAVWFVCLEGYAVWSPKHGDTYSETVYLIPVDLLRWVAGIALAFQVILHIHWLLGLAVFVWLPVHFVKKQMWH